MATVAEVDQTLHDLVRKLENASVEPRSLPERRTLTVHVRDLDLDYIAVFGEGRISGLEQGEPSGDEDVKISVSSDDLIALAKGTLNVGGAMLTGKLRIDAGMRDLLTIRHLF